MGNTNENSILHKVQEFFKRIFRKKENLKLLDIQSPNQNIDSVSNKLDYIKIDTDDNINDLKVSLENGYKKISELSSEQVDELIIEYEKDIKRMEKELAYKKSLL